jgi:hypothetical protein
MGFPNGPLEEAEAFANLVRPEIISIFPDLNRALRLADQRWTGSDSTVENDAGKASEMDEAAGCLQGFFGALCADRRCLWGFSAGNAATEEPIPMPPVFTPIVHSLVSDRPLLLFPACYTAG